MFNQNICWQLVSADSKVEKKISVTVDFRSVYKSWLCKLAQNGDSLSVLHFKCDFKHHRYMYTHTSRTHIYFNKPCTSSVQNWETHACFYNIKWKADGRHWSTEIKWNPSKSCSPNIPSNFFFRKISSSSSLLLICNFKITIGNAKEDFKEKKNVF